MFKIKSHLQLLLFIFLALFGLSLSGCSSFIKTKDTVPVLLKTENASKEQLLAEVNRFAKVNSMKAKVYVKFEDIASASSGTSQKYTTVDGDVVVQRPANIFLKLEFFKVDIAQMTSDGTKFRLALLKDNSGGKLKRFVIGTNTADYSSLKKELSSLDDGKDKNDASTFANVRPQHMTEAVLPRPISSDDTYTLSTISEEETNRDVKKKSPVARVIRGYYLLDEYAKAADGDFKISRRFWFDRVGGIRLARQQIFDVKGEIESDIVYGQETTLAGNPEYANLPMRIEVTRPKDKYKMSMTYQAPESVTIGKTYPTTAFQLQNSWELPEVNLDDKLAAETGKQTVSNTAIR